MKSIRFTRMHGAGNDFVLVDDRDESFPERGNLIAAMAADHTGISCEGVILLRKSMKADFRMSFYNPDGTAAELCGNGARCAAAFAKRIGVVKANAMTFETGAGLVDAEGLVDRRGTGSDKRRGDAPVFPVAKISHIVPDLLVFQAKRRKTRRHFSR